MATDRGLFGGTDRKGKKLSSDEIEHYQKMIVAVQRQSEVMEMIDKIIEL